jgi:hypothetical protein
MILARRIEHALLMTIDRPKCCDPRELDRAIVFGRLRQKVGRRQDIHHVTFCFGDDLGEMPDCVAQRREFAAILQHDGLGKTVIPRHDATPATEPGFKPAPADSFRWLPRRTDPRPPG